MKGDVVRSGGLAGYRRLLRKLGRDPDALLADVGIHTSDLKNPDRYVSYQAVITAIDAPASRFGISDFGLKLAGFQDISVIGPLAFVMQNSISVYHGMKHAADNIWFQSPNIRCRSRTRGLQTPHRLRLMYPNASRPGSSSCAETH